MSQTAIHIALTFDDNFWAPAYATMRSVCLATHRHADLNFHLCHRTLSTTHIADLKKIETEFGATLLWYEIDHIDLFNDIATRARYNKRLSNIVYARLLFAEILPPEIERLIYLDCDTYIRTPIEGLAEMDLQGFPVASVKDIASQIITNGRNLRENTDLFNTADPYFNAGMLVIDMRGWKAANILEKLNQAIADGTMDRIYYDQDFLNLVFKNNWLQLDSRWNIIDPRPNHEAFDPHLVHYTGPRKPWNLVSGVAYARIYRHTMTNELFYSYLRHRLRRRFAWLLGRKS